MGQIPRSLPTKLAERIECFDDERACGNGYVVTLHYGWTIDPGKHCGVFGADSVREVQRDAEARNAVPLRWVARAITPYA